MCRAASGKCGGATGGFGVGTSPWSAEASASIWNSSHAGLAFRGLHPAARQDPLQERPEPSVPTQPSAARRGGNNPSWDISLDSGRAPAMLIRISRPPAEAAVVSFQQYGSLSLQNYGPGALGIPSVCPEVLRLRFTHRLLRYRQFVLDVLNTLIRYRRKRQPQLWPSVAVSLLQKSRARLNRDEQLLTPREP